MSPAPPPHHLVDEVIARGLAEDLGQLGDLTTNAVVDAAAIGHARLVARAPGRIAGLGIATRVFTTMDPDVTVEALVSDGDDVDAGTTLAELHGSLRAILTGERLALNLLCHMSGIATATAAVVAAVAGTAVRVADTRKTLPGLRALQRYAVRIGGGANHRAALDAAVMIKDNHIAAAGSISDAMKRIRDEVGHTVAIEVEADTLEQVAAAVDAGAHAVLCDNMQLEDLERAVDLVGGRSIVEASGGITLETAAAVAATGVDVISLGALTLSAQALDIGLDL